MSARYRKKPMEIEARQWTGWNTAEIAAWVGEFVMPTLVTGHRGVTGFREMRGQDGTLTAQVYDREHDAWEPLVVNDWVLKGVRGEFYPCTNAVFRESYEWVGDTEETPTTS